MDKKNSTAISEKRKAEYKTTYDRLMARAVGREFERLAHERHHIVPRSLGGSNEKSNIVCLTYREHFLAHWLLTKFVDENGLLKMQKALWQMTRNSKKLRCRIVSGWQYEIARKANSQSMIGVKLCLGKSVKKETRDKISKKLKGNKNGRIPVRCVDDQKEFQTMNDAVEFYSVCAKSIRAVCRGLRKKAKGLRFEYIKAA